MTKRDPVIYAVAAQVVAAKVLGFEKATIEFDKRGRAPRLKRFDLDGDVKRDDLTVESIMNNLIMYCSGCIALYNSAGFSVPDPRIILLKDSSVRIMVSEVCKKRAFSFRKRAKVLADVFEETYARVVRGRENEIDNVYESLKDEDFVEIRF